MVIKNYIGKIIVVLKEGTFERDKFIRPKSGEVFTSVEDLPSPVEDEYIVVSKEVAESESFGDRKDILYPVEEVQSLDDMVAIYHLQDLDKNIIV
jgi:hypothetical protein